MESGCCAGVDGCMTWPRVGGYVVEVCIALETAFADRALESSFTEVAPVAVDQIGAHLVDHDADHKLRRIFPMPFGSISWLCCDRKGDPHSDQQIPGAKDRSHTVRAIMVEAVRQVRGTQSLMFMRAVRISSP